MSAGERTALVTGAARGIGEAIALDLAESGMNVVVNYRSDEERASAVADEIRRDDCTAMTVQADVTDADRVGQMAERVHDRLGPIDVLVNNAGITIDKKFENMERVDWDRVIDVNLGGMFNCTKAFYDDIRDAEHGRLINISSVVGEQGNYGQANYATTKSGMFGFTRTIALEMARSDSTANCVAPGFTRTPMLEKVPDRIQERILERIPLGRFAEVDDIACVVGFLAGERSAYMTGQIIGVNGGMDW